MAYTGAWVGKWIGEWLGVVASSTPSSITVPVAASIITLLVPSVVATPQTVATTTASSVTLSGQPISVVGSARLTIVPSVLTVFVPQARVSIPVIVSVGPSVVTYVATPVASNGGARGAVAAVWIALAPVTVGITTGASATVLASDVLLVTTPTTASGGTYALTQAQVITLVSTDVLVYDYNDAYIPTEGVMVKLNIPEIMAFSTDITTDMEVIDAMGDDMESMDGTQQVKLLRKTDNVVISLIDGTATPENKIYTFNHALIRQIADRDNRAVKQLRLFMQSVQNDDFATMDTIIELPMRDDVQILSGDIIQSDLQGTKYTVMAVDTCTLKTRWRVGARKFI
jgi:hypothetical protein